MKDNNLLERLRKINNKRFLCKNRLSGDLYCRHACGYCEPYCPHEVPVKTIMRYSHYFNAQGREREAIHRYAAIPGTNAGACQDCPGFCEKACPYGIPIQGMLLMAHDSLSLD